MKRFLGSFFLIALVAFSCATKEKPGFSKHFHNRRFNYGEKFKAKIKAVPPAWMAAQIEEDLSPFSQRNITLKALDETEAAALRSPHEVLRYRIVGNEVYVAKTRSFERADTTDHFQKALLALCSLVSLPDMDLIVNHDDGTWTPFYITRREETQAPIFGWAKMKTIPYLILIPDYRSISTRWFNDLRKLVEGKNYAGKKPVWPEKESKAFWRGVYSEPVHRLKIAQLSKIFPDLLDAGISPATRSPAPGGPLQLFVKPHASYEEHMLYKYLPVLDGNMCTYPGYQWRLLSGSLTLKQESDQIQWFYRALSPYVHYVPVANDLSDLLDKIEWAKGHDAECERIAANAKAFALDNLMFDDIYLYLYLALKSYASHLDPSMAGTLKKTAQDPRWKLIGAAALD